MICTRIHTHWHKPIMSVNEFTICVKRVNEFLSPRACSLACQGDITGCYHGDSAAVPPGHNIMSIRGTINIKWDIDMLHSRLHKQMRDRTNVRALLSTGASNSTCGTLNVSTAIFRPTGGRTHWTRDKKHRHGYNPGPPWLYSIFIVWSLI